MKKLFFLLLLCTLLTACCKDDEPDNPDDMNVPGLPPVTQTGQNTLGFLLNGQPRTPEGPNNLSIDFDPGIDNGILGIVAYKRVLNGNSSAISIGVRDSLNFYPNPKSFPIGFGRLGGAVFFDNQSCGRLSMDSTHHASGGLTITKLDRTQRIIAGTFEATLFNPQCGDTIRITKGRFDMKF